MLHHIKNFQEPFKIILGDFRAMESRIFDTEGSSEGEGRFTPLSEKYRKWKESNFPGRAIMTLRSDLRAALVGKSTGTVEKISNQSAEFGVNLPYAHRHQVGYKMPKRRIIQASEEAKRRWSRIVARWAMGLFEKYGIVNYGSYVSSGAWRD